MNQQWTMQRLIPESESLETLVDKTIHLKTARRFYWERLLGGDNQCINCHHHHHHHRHRHATIYRFMLLYCCETSHNDDI